MTLYSFTFCSISKTNNNQNKTNIFVLYPTDLSFPTTRPPSPRYNQLASGYVLSDTYHMPTNLRRYFNFTVDALLKRSPRLLNPLKPPLCGKMLIPLSQTFSHFSIECSDFLRVLMCFWFIIYIHKNIINSSNTVKFKSSLTLRWLLYIYNTYITYLYCIFNH